MVSAARVAGVAASLATLAAAFSEPPGHRALASIVEQLASTAAGVGSGEDCDVELSPGQALVGKADPRTGQRHFLGVPFAAPPVGDLRWRPPQPEAAWEGPRNAAVPGNSCMQSFSAFTIGSAISEDCLYLNVFAPPANASHAVPVMVFFYGGSWESGSASCPLYYSENLVANGLAEGAGVVVVTVNYRLSTFGFLGGEAMRDPSDNSTGNWGLQDQRRALRWVQRNIASFGGDPRRVTIFGESAGAGSVSAHLTSKQSWAAPDGPLFTGAIMESGNPATPWNSQPMSYAERDLKTVAKTLGCAPADQDEPVTVDQVNACMRFASAEDLFAARRGIGGSLLDWSPIVDGVELSEAPVDSLAAGRFAVNVTVLLGTNADEGSEFVGLDYDASFEEAEAAMLAFWGDDELGQAVINQYPPANYNGTEDGKVAGHGGFWAAVRAFGDGLMSCPARRTAAAFAAARVAAESTASTTAARVGAAAGGASSAVAASGPFLYFLNHTLDILKFGAPFGYPAESMGAFHGSELPFVFDFELGLLTSAETDLAKLMSGYWASFAAFADPGASTAGGSAPAWPAFAAENGAALALSAEGDPAQPTGAVEGLKQGACDFWDAWPIPTTVIFGPL